LKNDSIINSNVTDGLLSLPPVESKVTASHTMCGSGSAGKGGAILEVAMDDEDDDFIRSCKN
jgi:hypothetical protein